MTAILLYTWLLSASQGGPENKAGLQHNLGLAYWNLPGGDRQANLWQAIACYEAALQTFSLTCMDDYAEGVSSNLEAVKAALQQLEEG